METAQIADLIDRIMTGEPWHGPSVARLLEGISAASAAQRGSGAHGIWELVLHMTGWAREVTARLNGRAAQDPDDGDWPPITEATPAQWRNAQAALFAAHRELAAAVRQLDATVLSRPVKDFRDDAQGTGLSHYLTLHGLVHHTVYHSGQIALLKRALE